MYVTNNRIKREREIIVEFKIERYTFLSLTLLFFLFTSISCFINSFMQFFLFALYTKFLYITEKVLGLQVLDQKIYHRSSFLSLFFLLLYCCSSFSCILGTWCSFLASGLVDTFRYSSQYIHSSSYSNTAWLFNRFILQ